MDVSGLLIPTIPTDDPGTAARSELEERSNPHSSSSSLWYRLRFQFRSLSRVSADMRSDSLMGEPTSTLLPPWLTIVLCVPAVVIALWLPFVCLRALLGGGPGPMTISSVQNGLVAEGSGWRYRPGCSISRIFLAFLSFLACFWRSLRWMYSVQGAQDR